MKRLIAVLILFSLVGTWSCDDSIFVEISDEFRLIQLENQIEISNQARPEFRWSPAPPGTDSIEFWLDQQMIQTLPPDATSFTLSRDLETGIHYWNILLKNEFMMRSSRVRNFDSCTTNLIAPVFDPMPQHYEYGADLEIRWQGTQQDTDTYIVFINDRKIAELDPQSDFTNVDETGLLQFTQTYPQGAWYMDTQCSQQLVVTSSSSCIKHQVNPMDSEPFIFEYGASFSTNHAPELKSPVPDKVIELDDIRILPHLTFRWETPVMTNLKEFQLFINNELIRSIPFQQTVQQYDTIIDIEDVDSIGAENTWMIRAANPCHHIDSPVQNLYMECRLNGSLVDVFTNLTHPTLGRVFRKCFEDAGTQLEEIIGELLPPYSDVVFLIDNSISMVDDIASIQSFLDEIISTLENIGDIRLGAATYSDKNYDGVDWYTMENLTADYATIRSFIERISLQYGGDIPESVYDALFETITRMDWESTTKQAIIIMGDAPPLVNIGSLHTEQEITDLCTNRSTPINLYALLP
jgi:hypothetical protein